MNEEKLRCHCNNCSGELEFEASQIGETVACPLCGLDTLLYRQGPPMSGTEQVVEDTRKKDVDMDVDMDWTRFIKPASITLAVAGVVAFVIYSARALPPEMLGAVGSGLAGLAIMWMVVLTAVLWILFPVFVYFSLERMKKEMRESNVHLARVCELLSESRK